ncbi:MAG TPA: DUF4410 domain-containing protein [Acidobacteriota bacterium]|nr:DUF4410 domain-containing protein [Acidobacteriota bacterium]
MTRRTTMLVVLFGSLVVTGCTKYKVTQPLSEPIDRAAACTIGQLEDRLPPDTEDEDKPPLEDIDKFAGYLRAELEKRNIFAQINTWDSEAEYEINGAILTYRRGSGAVRFLIGFGLGNAEVTVELHLRNRTTGATLFSGNFKRNVSSGMESGIEMYKRIAKDFAKELDKQLKQIEKG